MTVTRCLYCLKITGEYLAPANATVERFIVGSCCQYSDDRDEAREIAAGMRPWARPLLTSLGNALPDEVAAEYQRKWEADQSAISAANLARQKGADVVYRRNV